MTQEQHTAIIEVGKWTERANRDLGALVNGDCYDDEIEDCVSSVRYSLAMVEYWLDDLALYLR
jgi:hypothetical protein